jgi:hypothetical protein
VGQDVLYVTERCVFRLCADGLELIEIAPGVDLQRDILDRMDFVPVMIRPPVLMDARIFRRRADGLAPRPARTFRSSERLAYDAQQDVFFVDFEGLSVRSPQDIAAIRDAVRAALAPLGRKVDAVVNYDRFSIVPELVDDYVEMVKGPDGDLLPRRDAFHLQGGSEDTLNAVPVLATTFSFRDTPRWRSTAPFMSSPSATTRRPGPPRCLPCCRGPWSSCCGRTGRSTSSPGCSRR